MSENYSPELPSRESEPVSSQETIENYHEIRYLVEWMLFESENDNPILWDSNQYRLDYLLALHGLPTDDIVKSSKIMRDKAMKALIDLGQEI